MDIVADVDVEEERLVLSQTTSETFVQDDGPRVQEGEEYVVSLFKGIGDVVGVKVLQSTISCDITVVHLQRGLLQQWNQAHPDLLVELGDKVVSVNGVGGPSAAVTMDQMFSENILEVVFWKRSSQQHDFDC